MRVMRTHHRDPQGRGMQPGRDAFHPGPVSLLPNSCANRPEPAIRDCPLPGIATLHR